MVILVPEAGLGLYVRYQEDEAKCTGDKKTIEKEACRNKIKDESPQEAEHRGRKGQFRCCVQVVFTAACPQVCVELESRATAAFVSDRQVSTDVCTAVVRHGTAHGYDGKNK